MLHSVKILHYKNYRQAAVSFQEKFCLINGDNGSGKTNLIDAVYYLCMCKSYFNRNDGLVIHSGQDYFRLDAVFDNEGTETEVVCKYVAGKKKEFSVNGLVYEKLTAHIGQFPVVIIAPNDIDLIYNASDERRRFLDISIAQFDKEYLTQLLSYNKIVQQRNALLKQAGQGEKNNVLLNVLDEQMIASGTIIHAKRRSFVSEFEPVFSTVYTAISNNKESPAISYISQLEKKSFHTLLSNCRLADIEAQRSTAGVHKDDVGLFINAMPVKETASQGQVKSILLALKLAQFAIMRNKSGKVPILLLDDIFEKLDKGRLQSLFKLLQSDDYKQVLITDADAERSKRILSELHIIYDHHTVMNGQIA